MNNSLNELLIIGMGGNSLEIYESIKLRDPHRNVGFLDAQVDNNLVVGEFSDIDKFPNSKKLFTVGSPKSFKTRGEIFRNLDIDIESLESYIDDDSWQSGTAVIGAGSIIMRNCYVGRNVNLGINSVLLPNVFVGHDSTIGEFTILAAGVSIAGGVKIGRQSYIGTNATIRDGVLIGENAMIGAGAVVISDIPNNCTYVGNPARQVFSKS